jgi:hypothetical protein
MEASWELSRFYPQPAATFGQTSMRLNKMLFLSLMLLFIAGAAITAFAVESGQFRLLSVSDSTKLILVSQIPNKTKYILDATSAKITVDGKPAEFPTLDFYTIINIKFDLRKGAKDGIETNGVVTEIRISTQENKK